jgi:pilus assembly protein CpaE
VFSPRGGSGKTTLSIGLAARISAGQADRTALLDLDLLFDDVGLLLGLDRQASLAEVHAQALDSFDRTALNEYLVRSAEGLRVMVSANRPEDGERLTAGHVRAALGALKQEFPVIVVDCGGSFAEPTLTALELADRVLLVCTPEMTTLRDARECQRLFGQGMHFSREKLYYVLNHPLPVRGLTREQFELALERPMAVEVPHAGVDLGSHLESHQLTDLARGRGPFGQAMERMCRDLIPAAGAGRGGPARSGVPAGRHRLLSRFRAR